MLLTLLLCGPVKGVVDGVYARGRLVFATPNVARFCGLASFVVCQKWLSIYESSGKGLCMFFFLSDI